MLLRISTVEPELTTARELGRSIVLLRMRRV